MKKNLFTLLALSLTAAATAQSNQVPAPNAVLVSQTRNGNTIVSRYKVPHDSGRHAEFDVHYMANNCNIVSTYSDNTDQISELKDFMAQTSDSTMHISAIHIVGYASPDGNPIQNDTLASKRAQSLYQYAVNTYHPKQKINTSHKAFQWVDCVPMVEKSDIPQKSQVLAILNSPLHSALEKEAALRKLPQAWEYLASQILPEMRYADIEFDYGVDEFVTRTTIVEAPKPAEPATPVSSPQPVIVEEEMGIIIATPKDSDVDKENKRDKRKAKRADKRGWKGSYDVVYW